METPIYNFVTDYMSSGMSRFHMPGHSFLGCEGRDITEIEGADVLSMAGGIIAESQYNASHLFCTGSTLYSTEGSSLCIKAMLMAVLEDARKHGSKGNEYILAGMYTVQWLMHVRFLAWRQSLLLITGLVVYVKAW